MFLYTDSWSMFVWFECEITVVHVKLLLLKLHCSRVNILFTLTRFGSKVAGGYQTKHDIRFFLSIS